MAEDGEDVEVFHDALCKEEQEEDDGGSDIGETSSLSDYEECLEGQTLLPEREEECHICLTSYRLSSMVSADCDHYLCKPDLADYLRAAINDWRFGMEGIECPVPDCHVCFNAHTTKDCLEDQGMAQLFDVYSERMVRIQYQMKCTKCQRPFDEGDDVAGTKGVIVTCPYPDCRYDFCVKGCEVAHEGQSCAEYLAHKLRDQQEEESLEVLRAEEEMGEIVR